MLNDSINIYCDESCHILNDHNSIMTLGAFTIPESLVRSISKQIREIKIRFGCKGELKWTKVSQKNILFYCSLINFFHSLPDLGFRALVVRNKHHLDHNQYNQGNHDSFYYKMYYYLIRNIVENQPDHSLRVYIDIKDTKSSRKVHQLHEILSNSFHDFSSEKIRSIQQIRSHESELMQLCDFFLGAVTYANRGLQTNQAKLSVIHRLEDLFLYSLSQSTPPWETKLNLFHFVPRGD